MKKIKSVQIIPNTAHPAVGSKVKIVFSDNTNTITYQDTLLGKYGTDNEKQLVGKEWK